MCYTSIEYVKNINLNILINRLQKLYMLKDLLM